MDAQSVTDAALTTLDEVGFEKLTMRAVADRLGVHVGGLYYHLPDKTAMVRSMADVVCGEIVDDLSATGDVRADVRELCDTVRRVLLRRRDTARVLAQSPFAASENAIALMDRLLQVLAPAVPEARLGTAGDTLLSYVTGYVLQEQIALDPSSFDPATVRRWAEQYPRVFADHGNDPDTQFTDAVDAILDGFTR